VKHLATKVTALPNLDYWPNSTCIGVYGPAVLGVSTPEKVVTLHARQIIFAPGALDALPLFVNNDLPGVMSARLVERLILAEGILPGRRAILWGAPALLERAALSMQQAGIELVYRLQPGEFVLAAKGGKTVSAAVVRDAAGRTHTFDCDLIVIALLQPRNELLAQAGGQLEWDDTASVLCAQRDRLMGTSIAGIRLVGEAAGLADTARCQAEGRLAGLAALRDLGVMVEQTENDEFVKQLTPTDPGNDFIFPTASTGGAGHVCFCEDVREWEIRAQMNSPYSVLELIKRRTAVVTGPCQGKFCLANAMRVSGYTAGSPTARPPAKPVRLKDLLAE
jgi:sarcosine oxidase subunit alpha